MNAIDCRRLCEGLLKAESERAVIEILQEAGYWDRPDVWRYYGDIENNWAQSGNQQSFAEAALAEKIVNSVDAKLINECQIRGIDPTGRDAPQSIRSAVARFFDHSATDKLATGGRIEDWSNEKTRKIAEQITVCATGTRPSELNISIADSGEGQSASRIPDTILSLNKSNKMRVHFVQGQFNQGGTGALRFCGEHNLQLVISRRNPVLLDAGSDDQESHWCFTVVRRERPDGERRNSVYTFLAPVPASGDAKPHDHNVLSFPADEFAIFPNDIGPYERMANYGTLIKLFDYRLQGDRSNILRGQSLLSRIDLLLPEIALPVRFYEYRRDIKGDYLAVASRRTTMSGLLRRIRKNQSNVVPGFPISIPLQPEGEKLIAHVYAFALGGTLRDADTMSEATTQRRLGGVRRYRKSEGVLFVRNGQTQGTLTKNFFRRSAMKMKPVADDLMVFVDCDELTDKIREDLFMPSRDRLTNTRFRQALEDALEKAIQECPELKTLRNKRQQISLSQKLEEEKPLADVLQSLIRNSPNLVTLLELGQRIAAPFDTRSTKSSDTVRFRGKFFPTFFKIKGTTYGKVKVIRQPINHAIRLTFETDVRDDYFTRAADRGSFELARVNPTGSAGALSLRGPTLRNGIATVTMELPEDVGVGDHVIVEALVKDTIAEFVNGIKVVVEEAKEHRSGGNRRRRKSRTDQLGEGRESPTQVALPRIKRVYRDGWEEEGFDEQTAMVVESLGYTKDQEREIYQFKVNMDNVALVNEGKRKGLSREQDRVLREQFLYANVLVGLSLLLESHKKKRNGIPEDNDHEEAVEDRIATFCRALAAFVPALVSLGSGDLAVDEDFIGFEEVG